MDSLYFMQHMHSLETSNVHILLNNLLNSLNWNHLSISYVIWHKQITRMSKINKSESSRWVSVWLDFYISTEFCYVNELYGWLLERFPSISKHTQRKRQDSLFVLFVASTCVSQERFQYVAELSKYISVTSLGKCHNNAWWFRIISWLSYFK